MTTQPEPDDPLADLLSRFSSGDRAAGEELFAHLYKDLRRLAAYFLRNERPGHSLSPTVLVNEAYLRLFANRTPSTSDRHHFLALYCSVMRRFLVDRARKHRSQKRDATQLDWHHQTLDYQTDPIIILQIDQALGRFAEFAERPARAVEMHYFGGLDHDEIAAILDVSSKTIRRDLTSARDWLAGNL